MSKIVAAREGNLTAYAADGATSALGAGTRVDLRRVPVRAELLPDLDQRPPSQVAVANIGGRYKLGFDSAVDNIGRGPGLDPRDPRRADDDRRASSSAWQVAGASRTSMPACSATRGRRHTRTGT